MVMFKNFYAGKKVLITGNTGFKGSWLSIWLDKLGADVYGLSNGVLTEPALFVDSELENKFHTEYIDIRDRKEVTRYVQEVNPDIVFHLAAQAIVSESYSNPIETLEVNAMGTANLLEALRSLSKPVIGIFITSDKCYENVEWEYGYREIDRLGGKDVYSASKACAEIIFSSYTRSFGVETPNLMVASARAGNVIGGGDWSKDRIVVDIFKSWFESMPVNLRAPHATRPWQHVLEPLSGYLTLAIKLSNSEISNGESFNFGPLSEQNYTVKNLAESLFSYYKHPDRPEKPLTYDSSKAFSEAGLLKLSCDKAKHYLNWEPNLRYEECVSYVANWYAAYNAKDDVYHLTSMQIDEYCSSAKERGLVWTK